MFRTHAFTLRTLLEHIQQEMDMNPHKADLPISILALDSDNVSHEVRLMDMSTKYAGVHKCPTAMYIRASHIVRIMNPDELLELDALRHSQAQEISKNTRG